MMIVMLALGVAVTVIGIDLLPTGSGFAYAVIPLGIVFIGLSALFLQMYVRPMLTVTAESLRILRPFRTLDIPLADVTGIGLVFKRRDNPYATRRGVAGWYLTVWRGPGQDELVPIAYAPALLHTSGPRARERFLVGTAPSSGPDSGEHFSLETFDPAAQTDPARLAATYAGQVASQVYQRILAQQGPAGLLAQQKGFPAVRDHDAHAYWFPDGVIGRPGLHQARSAADPGRHDPPHSGASGTGGGRDRS